MHCPVCKGEQLIVLEYQQIEVDYCTACRGVWLDSGELELLFGDDDATAKFLSIGEAAVVPAGEKPRRCPECNRKMTKESTSSDPPVTFDHCPLGDGLWFDGGELHTVLTHAETLVSSNEVAAFLKEVFPEQ